MPTTHTADAMIPPPILTRNGTSVLSVEISSCQRKNKIMNGIDRIPIAHFNGAATANIHKIPIPSIVAINFSVILNSSLFYSIIIEKKRIKKKFNYIYTKIKIISEYFIGLIKKNLKLISMFWLKFNGKMRK
jgi:hypothetical protein